MAQPPPVEDEMKVLNRPALPKRNPMSQAPTARRREFFMTNIESATKGKRVSSLDEALAQFRGNEPREGSMAWKIATNRAAVRDEKRRFVEAKANASNSQAQKASDQESFELFSVTPEDLEPTAPRFKIRKLDDRAAHVTSPQRSPKSQDSSPRRKPAA